MYARELATHQHRDLRIELDGLYAVCTMLPRAKDLETAASTDDEHGPRRGDLVCEGTGTVTQEFEARRIVGRGRDGVHVIAVREQTELRRRFVRGHQAQARGMAQRDPLALDYVDTAERARARLDYSRPRDAQRLAQGLVLTRVRTQPVSGDAGEHEQDGDAGGERRTPARSQFDESHDRCDRTRAGHQLEREFGRQLIQQPQDQQAADARACEIGGVNPSGPRAPFEQRKGNGVARAEEGEGECKICERKPHGLPCIPQQLLGLKRQRRCGDGRGHREDAEHQEIQEIRIGEPVEQPPARYRNERTARAEAEQRQADHHRSEVMPVNDREVAGQQDFVCKRGARDQGDRPARQPLSHFRRDDHRSEARIAPAGSGGS